MKLKIDNEIRKSFPELRIGIIIIEGISPFEVYYYCHQFQAIKLNSISLFQTYLHVKNKCPNSSMRSSFSICSRVL